jgi:hypothetical protein
MQIKQDYYQVLGIAPSASVEEIHEAYRRLAFQFHPDRNEMSLTNNQKMQEINEAYDTLTDPIKRRGYDMTTGHHNVVPKFETGSKVRVSARSSPYNDYIGVVDRVPIYEGYRFWYVVKVMSNGLPTVTRFAEEQLNEVDESGFVTNEKRQVMSAAYNTLSGIITRTTNEIQTGYHIDAPRFKRGSKVKVCARASPYNDHIGLVQQEPVKGNFRFWYMVEIRSNGLPTVARFAEEQLNEVDE